MTDGYDVLVVDASDGSSSSWSSVYPSVIADEERRAAPDRLDDREYYRGDDDGDYGTDGEDDVEATYGGVANVTTAAMMISSPFHAAGYGIAVKML
jgi:hypothetical protein